MLMQRAVLVLGLAAVSASVGCGYVQDPCVVGPRSGNDHVLNFNEGPPAAQGLVTQVRLTRVDPYYGAVPGVVYSGDPRECFAFDGAEVQVQLPPAFQGETATVIPPQDSWGDFVIQFRCSAPVGQMQRVPVKVVAGDEVRYEDSFNVTCHEVRSANATPVAANPWGRGLTGNGYIVGGLVHVSFELRGSAFELLGGSGVLPADSLLVAEGQPDVWRGTQAYRVAAPGQSPALQIGPIREELPITLLGDDAWQLKLEKEASRYAHHPSEGTGVFDFRAWPVNAEGDKLDGLDGAAACQWTAHTGSGSIELLDRTCDLLAFATNPGTGGAITRMCVTTLGRTACEEIPQ